MTITSDDVIAAYRHLLGREPESLEAVTGHTEACKNMDQLLSQFVNSAEFSQRFSTGVPIGRNMDIEFCGVDVAATEHQRQSMFERIGASWTKFGESAAHWSVLTLDQFMPDVLDVDEFYNTGVEQARIAKATLMRNGIDISAIKHVTDFGCGVGRMTMALAQIFPHVVGVDISGNHLKFAKERAESRSVDNVEFMHLSSLEMIRSLPSTDFFYSVIVLQHNPPPVIAEMLGLLLERVNPKGVALFQIPTFRKDYVFKSEDYLACDKDEMEMHVLPQKTVFEICSRNFNILEVREDNLTGDREGVSQTFLVQRR